MKKLKPLLVSITIILLASSLFAQSAQRLEPVDVRSTALGTSYYTDTETFYSLFNNPATIAFTGDMILWFPNLSVVTGGDVFKTVELAALITDATSGTPPTGAGDLATYTDLYNDLNDFIGEDGFNASVKIGGPLTFGSINNNFGWGVFNTIDVSAKLNTNGDLISFDLPENLEDLNDLISGGVPTVPGFENALSLPIVTTVDFNTDILVGYAVPFDFGILGNLSFGVSARGITQLSMVYKDDFKNIYQSFDSFDALGIPASATLGLGLDLGVQYEFLDMVSVALVWQDFYSPIWTNSFEGLSAILEKDAASGFQYSVLNPQLGIGASVDLVPLETLTGGFISHAAAYANYADFLQFVRNAQSGELYQDPLLDLAVGAEVVLMDMVALRLGMNQLFISGGVGVYLGDLRLDASFHNEELGYAGTDWKQFNFGLSVTYLQM